MRAGKIASGLIAAELDEACSGGSLPKQLSLRSGLWGKLPGIHRIAAVKAALRADRAAQPRRSSGLIFFLKDVIPWPGDSLYLGEERGRSMKLSLVVTTAGKMQGKTIPITLPEFIIGRDPECHLRPASPLISKKHCAFLMEGNKASVRDFGSTNGTLVNNETVAGEREIGNGDLVKVGPIEFRVELEVTPAVRQTPTPRSMPSEADDAAAALFLSLGDDDSSACGSSVDGQGVPTGSTIMETINLPPEGAPPEGSNAQTPADDKANKDRMTAAKAQAANTSTAAKAILEKYMRRPRGG